jgi:tripartite-type tricarboxylate transporter receptor subunit TctC
MGYWFGAYVPAGTPDAIVTKLNDLLIKATQAKAAQHFYNSTGTTPATSTPQELAAFQRSESQKWGDIIKKAGIKAE